MFTGIIEEVGSIVKIEQIAGGKKIKISAPQIINGVKIDDSVAVNGICLTATKLENESFWVDAVGETLTKSTLQNFHEGLKVNLERAMLMNGRLGGHIVQGHVNGTAKITQITKLGENYFLEINIPDKLLKYVIEEGSICIDGISLTIARLESTKVGVSVIPHTWANTCLKHKKIGELVNIETDVIAKYIERLMMFNTKEEKKDISIDWLKQMGY